MRLGIPKIHQHAIAHVFRNEASSPLHGRSDTLLIRRNDLAEVFGVHAGRKCGRTHKVREHHSNLAAFGGISPMRLNPFSCNSCCGGLFNRAFKFGNRTQHFAAITENDAQFLQILIS
jgi:hypothetical protein